MRASTRFFLIAALAGVAVALAYGLVSHFGEGRLLGARQAEAAVEFRPLAPGVLVAAQISPRDLKRLRETLGVKAVIDMRPDGEDARQTPAAQMAAAAADEKLAFSYVPTPHGAVPGSTLDAFDKAFGGADRPTLLYCRSGSRAARVWALHEASRPGGLDAHSILRAVRGAGLSADAEKAEIERRIAARAPQ